MKKMTALLVLGSSLVLFSGCATTGSSTTTGAGSSSATTKGKAKPYPLNTCIVTDNELGSMGTPLTKVYQGQTVKFCCKPCVREFDADPEKFLSKIK